MTSPALRKVSRAADKAASALKARDDLIREAAMEHSLREIAKAAGLSHQRIHQIVASAECGEELA